jgi:hypothetical protein
MSRNILTALLIGMLLPELAQGQNVVPFWIGDGWRSKNYPASDWYTCFIQSKGEKSDRALKQLEREAREEIADSIFLRMSKGKADYMQMVKSAVNSEKSRAQSHSYYHPSNGIAYAFVAIKKTDFFSHYESVIKSGLSEAINTMEQGKQFASQGRKRKAFEKFAESKKQVEKLSVYREFLTALDSENGIKYSQSENSKNLLNTIADAHAETEKIRPIYINGSEKISGVNPEIMIPGLFGFFDGSGCLVTDEIVDASYHVRVDARTCNTKKVIDSYYCQACVSANITNVKTKASVQQISFTSSMAESYELEEACYAAFEMALNELWGRISERALPKICD